LGTLKLKPRASGSVHATAWFAGQFHTKLLALTLADDRQVHDFASLSVADRVAKLSEVTGSPTCCRTGKVTRFVYLMMIVERNDRSKAHEPLTTPLLRHFAVAEFPS
jgi:hypothetical protein